MSKQAGGGYPSPGKEASLSGPPKVFSHIKKIGPEYNNVASGEREKAPLRHYAPRMNKAFRKAHEGPRETIGKPQKHKVYTLNGIVEAEIHSREDHKKRLRNLKKDLQMKQWREAKYTMTKRFNARTLKPVHLRDQKTPGVFQAAARKAALKKRLEQKKDNAKSGHEL